MIPVGPHAGQPVLRAGPSVGDAGRAVIAVHGRGANAADIIGISQAIDLPDVSWLAPDASSHTWYPYSFLTPVEQNQPFLDSALSVVGGSAHRSALAIGLAVALGVATLAAPFDMALPSLMKHIAVLESSGLIRSSKLGRSRTCELMPAALQEAERWIAEQRALWEARSDRMAAFVERLHHQQEQPHVIKR